MKKIVKALNIITFALLVVWVCSTNVLADPNSSKGFLSYSEENQKREKEELEKAEEQEKNAQTVIKSTDNYLKNLEVDGYSLTPEFDKQTVNYEIKEDVQADFLEIKAETDDERASISGIGKVALNSGENNLKIEVTAESGTVRTYFIKVIKEVKENLRLTDLKLKANGNKIDLDSDFDSEKFEYYCNVSSEISKIDIEATSNVENSQIEIDGQDNLKEGMNQVFVTIRKDNEKVTYKINIYKEKNIVIENNNSNIILGTVLGICLVIIIIKFKENKNERKNKK